jgi:hypothetical protein
MKRRAKSLYVNVCFSLALLAGLTFGPVSPAFAQPWTYIERFSLSGFVAGQAALLLENIVALSTAQAEFQEQLDSARNALKTGWRNAAERERAAGRLAELLFQKDLMYALMPFSEGVTEGWKRSEAFNRLSGAPFDGGISLFSQAAFLHWVQTVRAHLGVYDDNLLSPQVSANWTLMSSAIEKSQSAYRRYSQARDAEELARFLPVPPARLATDGSGLLSTQTVDSFSAVGWGITQRQPLGPKLRELAELNQPMLECTYGPIMVGPKEQLRAVYPVRLFWYKTPPTTISTLVEIDNNPTLTGFLGGFTGLGSDALSECPESEKQADALYAANVAKHHATLTKQKKQDTTREAIKKKCGDDMACARRETRLMAR